MMSARCHPIHINPLQQSCARRARGAKGRLRRRSHASHRVASAGKWRSIKHTRTHLYFVAHAGEIAVVAEQLGDGLLQLEQRFAALVKHWRRADAHGRNGRAELAVGRVLAARRRVRHAQHELAREAGLREKGRAGGRAAGQWARRRRRQRSGGGEEAARLLRPAGAPPFQTPCPSCRRPQLSSSSRPPKMQRLPSRPPGSARR